jgi:hypothetical protein
VTTYEPLPDRGGAAGKPVRALFDALDELMLLPLINPRNRVKTRRPAPVGVGTTTMPTYKRADLSKVLPAVQCTARKQNGEPCRARPARGANVCRVHGGSAPQVKAAAKRRLAQAADVLVQRLPAFALDGDTTDNVALQAIIAALDRGGLTAKQAIEIGVDPAPWEEVLSNLAGIAQITREESRAARGLPAAPELPGGRGRGVSRRP